MEERSMLADALKQLDELFLLVVVGEFNSGKSTVINALLGERFLEEGILPTTNEISVLKHGDVAQLMQGKLPPTPNPQPPPWRARLQFLLKCLHTRKPLFLR
jgi:Dynamin family